MRPSGADLAVNANLVLADTTLDAKLVLSGPERPDAPAGMRPEVTITLKGPFDAPKRTLDTAAFANWLALRNVDQQTKRIDALEQGREVPTNSQVRPAVPTVVPPRATTPARPRPTSPSLSYGGQTPPRPPLDIRPPGL
jgi:large subunit ribosomal protein L24